MDIIYNPPERTSNRYDTCELIMEDGTRKILDSSPSSDLRRANLEYDSPLVKSEFPEGGAFYHVTYAVTDEQSVSTEKVFKPRNCRRIILTENYGDSENPQVATCTVEFNDYETPVSMLLNFSSQTEFESSSEIVRHLQNSYEETSYGFSFQPHVAQINGSDFRVSNLEYAQRGRDTYTSNFNIIIPEFMNFSLARDMSKYFIGAYARNK